MIRRPLVTAFLAVLALALPGRRAEAADHVILDLPRILDLADRNHPNIAAARARLLQARAQLDEAHWAPFSQFRFTGGIGLAPTVRGNSVFSPNTDVSLTSSLGVAWRAGIEGAIPLWTFGKITNLWDAAGAQVRLNQATIEKERDDVRVDVRKAYFGLQLARDSLLLLKDVSGQLDKAVAAMQQQVDKDEGDPIELLRIQTYTAELEVRQSEAGRYVNVALAGLRFYAGTPELDIPDLPLRPPRHQLGHIIRYLEAARLYRPEIAMVRAGISARQAQVHLARAQLYPDIGIGLSAGLSTAPEVADQLNPFVTDPGNYFHYGAALVFQWKLDVLPQAARIRYAEAQLEEVRAQQRFALGGVGAEVEVAYAEVIDWKRRVEAYTKAVGHAKRWLVMVQQGIDVGTKEDKDLLDPARAYATNRYAQLNATMELDMAMSRLAKATGWDAIAPDGDVIQGEPLIMDTTDVFLRPRAVIEPLFNQWYAWTYLLAPASSAMYVANAHLKLMQSFVVSPQIHVSALKNPAMRGGPFLDIDPGRADDVKALLERTTRRVGPAVELAEAVKALEKILAEEAKGFSLEALYRKVPEALRGYVELVYDLRDSPSVRFFEALLYRSRHHDPGAHSVCFTLMKPDARRFVLSTPRLEEPGEVMVPLPFTSRGLDDVYRMRHTAAPFGAVREALGVDAATAESLRPFFTPEPPRRRPAYDGAEPRIRYFGHACLLVESPGVAVMFDPIVSYDYDGVPDRFTHADLPAVIDYVVITHNHQDHVMIEPLLDLRHRIRTVLVPRSGGGSLADPSLKLILEHLGFADVRELGEMDEVKIPGGSITALPFLGEHGDLDIRTKLAYAVKIHGRTALMMADSNNLDPRLYDHIHALIGDVAIVFIGMECEGAPMSWLYGPLFTRPLVRKNDQSRRFDGSDCDKAMKIVERFKAGQVYVYALGQEPWLGHVMSIHYTPESPPIAQSDKLIALCKERGVVAERLFLTKEIAL